MMAVVAIRLRARIVPPGLVRYAYRHPGGHCNTRLSCRLDSATIEPIGARKDVLVDLKTPYLLFLGDAHDQLAAKTAAGVAHWRPEWCVGQFRLPGCKADLGL